MTVQPRDVTDLDIAFGGSVRDLMPAYDDIPDEFKHSNNPYVRLQMEWFFKGLSKNKLKAKPGVDANKAFRHLSAIQGSFDPRHEHKEAAVAYLMSQWFDLA